MAKAVYATNTSHYQAPVAAMQAVAKDLTLVRRAQVPMFARGTLDRLPGRMARSLSRRMPPALDPRIHERSLGFAQFIPVIQMRAGLTYGARSKRLTARLTAGAVARHAVDADVFHFSELHGWRTLREGRPRLAIMERRSFHHADYEAPLEPHADFPYHGTPDPMRDLLEEEYEQSDVVLAYSSAQAVSLSRHGVPAGKIRVVPLPVLNLGRVPHAARPRKHFAFVGRLDIHKGIDVASAAVRLLPPGTKLRVAGPSTAETRRWLATQSHLEYLGVLDFAALADLYETSVGLISPSVESFGLAPLEAAAHGCHVFGRETTGIMEYLPRSVATVIEGRDPAAWAAALEGHLDSSSGDFRTDWLDERALDMLSFDAVVARLQGIYTGSE